MGPDHEAQDGTHSPWSAKEAAQKLFAKTLTKDTPVKSAAIPVDVNPDPPSEGETDRAWTEDPAEILWDTVSTPALLASGSEPSTLATQKPEPTLREIFAAVTSCNTNLSNLTTELMGEKIELTLVRQDMKKLINRTAALEGCMSNTEDDAAPLQHEV